MNNISLHADFSSWRTYPELLNREINNLPQSATIIEIGGGANPSIPESSLGGRKYYIIDISNVELSKAKGSYFETINLDISKNILNIKADLVISKMVLEHILSPKEMHSSIFNLLNETGVAIHFFATLWSPASFTNLILPESVSNLILKRLQNRKWETEGKFPAFYKWCWGPTKNQIKRWENLGFLISEYYGYLGSGYVDHITFLRNLERLYNWFIFKLNSPYFCTNAIVVLKK